MADQSPNGSRITELGHSNMMFQPLGLYSGFPIMIHSVKSLSRGSIGHISWCTEMRLASGTLEEKLPRAAEVVATKREEQVVH